MTKEIKKVKGCKCEEDNKLTQALCPLHGAPAYRVSTLRTRFEQREDFTKEAILAFIAQEFELLAEEVDKNAPEKSGTFFLEGMRKGSSDAASLIREKIKEIKL